LKAEANIEAAIGVIRRQGEIIETLQEELKKTSGD